jgi:hypothetical protein
MKIDKERSREHWEQIYAEAYLKLQNPGLILEGDKSHTKSKAKIYRLNPAYTVFKDASNVLARLNGWYEETTQLELDLE